MADQETSLAQKLRDYVDTVRSTDTLDKLRVHCMDLLLSLPDMQLADFKVEKDVYEGRVYTLLGNLVFDFERNLHWQLKDMEIHIKHYINDLQTRRPLTSYVVIATDGLSFHVYMPQYDESGKVMELEKIHGLNLASPMMTPERAMDELGMVFLKLHRPAP